MGQASSVQFTRVFIDRVHEKSPSRWAEKIQQQKDIQVIAKDRFSKKAGSGVETLRSEVAILQAISHCGIVRLESMSVSLCILMHEQRRKLVIFEDFLETNKAKLQVRDTGQDLRRDGEDERRHARDDTQSG